VEPRYYDPVKEDIENRTSRIKKELELSKEGEEHPKSSISGAFSRRSRESRKASIIQLLLIIFFITISLGYLQFCNNILYLFLVIVPIYFYVRLKGKAHL